MKKKTHEIKKDFRKSAKFVKIKETKNIVNHKKTRKNSKRKNGKDTRSPAKSIKRR
jgi:hypothetical protein